jgi:hypothetical protein
VSLREATKLVSSSVRLPSEKDTPEVRASKLYDYANKMGRPATAADYVLTPPILPDGVPFDTAQLETFKPVAHGLRLTQEQVNGLVAYDAQRAIHAQQAIDVTRTEWQATLAKEWGTAYPTNKALAIRGLTEYGGKVLGETEAKAFLDLLDSSGLGDHPALVKIFAAIGAEHNEGSLVTGESVVPTAESLDAEIAKLQALPEFMNTKHPQHDAVMENTWLVPTEDELDDEGAGAGLDATHRRGLSEGTAPHGKVLTTARHAEDDRRSGDSSTETVTVIVILV